MLSDSKSTFLDTVNIGISPFAEAVAWEALMTKYTENQLESKFPLSKNLNKSLSEIYRQAFIGNNPLIKDSSVLDKVNELLKTKTPFFVGTPQMFDYPDGLRDDCCPPRLFYYKGDIGLLRSRSVSVVGSRQASSSGIEQTKRIVKKLVGNDFTVVSGLAKGVDTAALETALSLGGQVIAVIGTPVDEYYPRENKQLQDKIADHLLISAVPFYHYHNIPFRNRRFYFPRRNTIMSAISDATIIVEVSETSGTRVQARAAIQQGRQLLIMDNCFQKAQWPHKLIDKGAHRVADEDELLNLLTSNE